MGCLSVHYVKHLPHENIQFVVEILYTSGSQTVCREIKKYIFKLILIMIKN
jgi:hypothetical protein